MGWKKLEHLSQKEYRGIRIPLIRTPCSGNKDKFVFADGTHEQTYAAIRDKLEEVEISFPTNLFGFPDLQAYTEWLHNYENKTRATFAFEIKQGESFTMQDIRDLPNPLYAFDDFAVNVLNMAKVGTFDEFKRDIVYTADKEPHITFEPWLREGFRIVQPPRFPYGFKLDERTKLFIPDKPTSTQFLMNREAQAKLSEELGREV